ncbi:MAG: hypothetical protein JSV03_13035, partial [Planctomycetota bacterium]
GHWDHYWGPGFYRHGYYGVVGSRTQTVHLRYLHTLFVSAWIEDKKQPTGRRVIWEGCCDTVSSEKSLKLTMPYLMSALEGYYNRATERPVTIKLDPDDEFARRLASVAGSAGQSIK